ncbi:ABC transporter ATP-binding protein/permease [Candidatus Pelagibacter sp.]|nr:ABC transporter ATP-binding protein/permease [Candidatus Pelagibacter sp.]
MNYSSKDNIRLWLIENSVFNHIIIFTRNHLPKKARIGALTYIFLSLVQTVLDLFAFSLFIPVIIFIIDSSLLQLDNQYLNFLNFYISDYLNDVPKLFGIFFVIFFIKYILSFLINIFQIKYSYNLIATTRSSLLEKYTRLDYMSVLKMKSNVITNGLILNVERAIEVFFINFLHFVKSTIHIIIFTVFLATINFNITVWMALISSSILIIYYLFIKTKITNFGKKKYNYNSIFVKNIQDIYGGFHIIKLFKLENKIINLFKIKSLNYARISSIYKILITFPKISKEIILLTLLIGLFFLLEFLNYSDNEISNYITIFGIIGLRLFPQLLLMFNTVGNIKHSQFSMETLNKELSEFDKKKEKSFIEIPIEKSIELKNISFNYGDENKEIFKDLNFKISTGEIIGLEGENGTGKSTFLKVISGLIKPSKGEIIIDDKKLNNFENYNWQNNISYVEQNVFLFNDTILQNITLNEEKYNKEKLDKIIAGINLRDFIELQDEGLNKVIAENNSNVSGGEKQKIAICRALYRNCKFILFDESLSNIDEKSVLIIKDYLKSIKDIGIIIISHKKSTLSFCDKVYNLKNKKFNI